MIYMMEILKIIVNTCLISEVLAVPIQRYQKRVIRTSNDRVMIQNTIQGSFYNI